MSKEEKVKPILQIGEDVPHYPAQGHARAELCWGREGSRLSYHITQHRGTQGRYYVGAREGPGSPKICSPSVNIIGFMGNLVEVTNKSPI